MAFPELSHQLGRSFDRLGSWHHPPATSVQLVNKARQKALLLQLLNVPEACCCRDIASTTKIADTDATLFMVSYEKF